MFDSLAPYVSNQILDFKLISQIGKSIVTYGIMTAGNTILHAHSGHPKHTIKAVSFTQA